MFQTNPSKTMTDLAKYGVGHYAELELDGQPCERREEEMRRSSRNRIGEARTRPAVGNPTENEERR
jgi:hypothetical protein